MWLLQLGRQHHTRPRARAGRAQCAGSGNRTPSRAGTCTNATSDGDTIFQEKMRLGLGWIARDGVTQDQKQKAESGQVSTPEGFTTTSGTFETSIASAVQAQLPGITSESSASDVQSAFKSFTLKNALDTEVAAYGQRNIIDVSKVNDTKKIDAAKAETVRKVGNTDFSDISEIRYQIQRNNTGYVLRYLSNGSLGNESELDIAYVTDEAGNRISYVGTYNGMNVVAVDGKVYEVLSQKVIYDTNRNSLTQIDKKYIYVGMFSARKSSMTVEEYTLETVDPEQDYPAEEREMEPIALNALVMSAETSNTAAYDLIFSANADGTLTVEKDGKVVAQEMAVTSGKWATIGTSLKLGDNKFNIVFTPTPGYAPGEYQYLVIDKDDPTATSKTLEYTVKYKALSGNIIYVAPGASGDGSKESPASIYDAVSYAAPGQTIYLAGGKYNLGKDNGGSNKNLRIERGTDGTASKMIVMETNPEDVAAGNRAVLSFAGATGTGSAFMLTGNYWHLKNFDVTGSKNGEKGLHIAGKHNVVEMVNAYMNGNTGIEIAREGSVGRDLWPSDNLILNCTSYLNYDAGFEDADGFAAKITCGEGNRFVGCVSAYNADDGWDLFAKVQTGSIGSVTIENSIAYKNGYLLGSKDSTSYSVFVGPDSSEFEAVNGNGFKLSGDGMSGYHVLSNSYAFGNKANGIDSNSCPDIQVFNSVSYSNGTNLVLNNYAKAINSDYTVKGLISIGSNKTKKDSIDMLGAQVASKIYNISNFFWNGSESVNAADASVKASDKIFVNVDPATLGVNVAEGKFVARDNDGSIRFNGFLQLKKSEDVEDPELKSLLKFIEDNGIGASEEDVEDETAEFVVFAKEVKTLAGVESKDINGTKLPEGYSWADSTALTASYAGTTAEFAIVNATTGKTSKATVSFVEVSGVELNATTDVAGGIYAKVDPKEAVLEATPVYSPEVVISEEVQKARFKYTFADKNKMALKEVVNGNAVTLSRNESSKEGYADYVASMQFTAGGSTYKFTSNSISFRTRVDRVNFTYAVSGATAYMGDITVAKVGDKFKFTELKVEGVAGSEKVNVAIGDSKILKYANGEYTALMSGTTYLTLTAAGDKTVQLVLMVKVQGKQFAVNVDTITVDKAKNDGTSFVVTKLGDAEPGVLSVSKVLKGTSAKADLKDAFEVTKVIGNVYKISVKANADETVAPKIATGSYSVVFASEEEEFEPVKVVVTETKPTATLKQTKKVNLFYKAGSVNNTGAIKATSKLASVTLKISADSDFNLAADGDQYQIIMTSTAQRKIESGSKLNTRITLTESFDGYKKAYDKTVNYTVQTQTLAPKYKLELDNSVLYTQLGIKDSEFRVLNLATGEYLSDATIKLASSTKSYVNANKYFTIDEEGGVYRISTTKNGTAKISVVDPDFSKNPKTKYTTDREVILNARLTINKTKPVVKIANAKINGQAEYAAYSDAAALVTVKNALDYNIRNLALEGNNKASKNILPFIEYYYDRNEFNQPYIAISFKDSADMTIEEAIKAGLIKKGSYSFTANYDINKIENMKTKFTLTVMTGAKAIGRVKGTINLVARDNSYVKVSPYITNLGGTVTDMYFAGAENLFDVEWDSAANLAKVYATENGSYRVNGKYRVTPVFVVATYYGEVEIAAAPVTIQTKQTQVKLTAAPVVQVKMSDVASEGYAVVNVTSPKGAEIEYMTQLSQQDKFNVSYDAKSGNLFVAIANVKGLKVNTTYSIKMSVVPVGNGVGAKAQNYTIKVKVTR